jgi:hypothetical protein
MTGDGDARTCPHCNARVFDVAMLDPDEAERLIAARPDHTVLHRRTDGTFVAGDCGVARPRNPFARLTAIPILLALTAVAGAMLYLRAPHVRQPVPSTLGDGFGPPEPPLTPSELRAGQVLWVGTPSLEGLAEYSLSANIERRGQSFAITSACDRSHEAGPERTVIVPAAAVQHFLDVLAARRPVEGRHRECARLKAHGATAVDDARIVTTVRVPSGRTALFQVDNCSYQWLESGVPLEGDDHDDITKAFFAMVAPIDLAACVQDVKEHPHEVHHEK